MLKKVCHWIFSLFMVAGFIILYGTAGASDLDSIAFSRIVYQLGIALFFMVIGFGGLKITE